VQKARNGILDAVGLSSVGLSRIDSGVSCLQVPMMLESYAELDYVRDAVAKDLERQSRPRASGSALGRRRLGVSVHQEGRQNS
jgi:hypothetical protein